MALPMEVLVAQYGIGSAPATETVAPMVEAQSAKVPGPDGWLEDRDEYEVEPPSRFQGVPKWKQAGRKYLDELTEEEWDELIKAQVERGEVIEEPPQRPEAWSEP